MLLLRVKYTSAILVLCCFISGCITKEDIDRFVDEQIRSSDPIVKINDPEDSLEHAIMVERDFEEIRSSGVLRMITHYGPNTYFLHQGFEEGFEYELLYAFAREHDLVLEVVIIDADEDPRELLLAGDGDVIAANYTITPERRKSVNFTQPYNLANKILVYSRDLQTRPGTLEELSGSGVPISVRQKSSGSAHLNELVYQGYDLTIEYIPDQMDTKSLLDQIAMGSIKAVVLSNKLFHPASRYMQELIEGPVIAEADSIAWGIRGNAPDLGQQMNSFLQKHFRFSENMERPRRSAFLNVLRQRYFQEGPQIADYYNPDWHYSNIGLESSYDHVIHSVADSLELDWKLVTAMIVQESSFNPGAKSWAGAVGLMQIIPRFSSIEYQNLYDPVINIREGAGILKAHLDHYSYLDSLNQKSFALATYNVGLGHMADARRLVIDQNKDPNEWENVADALLRLMQRSYHQDARYGYKRGIETVRYVKEILNRYQMYNQVALYAERNSMRESGVQTVGMLEH